jgi:hypothetical protein
MMARATQGLALVGASLGAGGVTWIAAQSLGMHGSSGGVLWSGGLITAALGLVGSLLALWSLNTEDEQARVRAFAALVLCPIGVFASAFLIAVGQSVLATH